MHHLHEPWRGGGGARAQPDAVDARHHDARPAAQVQGHPAAHALRHARRLLRGPGRYTQYVCYGTISKFRKFFGTVDIKLSEWVGQIKLYTEIPAYSDTAYGDTPLTVTL